MKLNVLRVVTTLVVSLSTSTVFGQSATQQQDRVKRVVDEAIRPVMQHDGIPGMAVGIIVAGQSYVFDYGLASKAGGKPVTHDTLFELGSISKTLTATLASYAQVDGKLKLSDRVDTYLPQLQGTQFGAVSLINLGTHTPGGVPLQVPENLKNNAQLMKYLADLKPTYAPGTYRTYSNVGIGMLGLITAQSMQQDFATLMEQRLFPALGMKHSYIHVPPAEIKNYAQGYTSDDVPIRMAVGVLSEQAYGVRSTASDMIRFVAENMQLMPLDVKFQRAITDTHTGYYKVGSMTQDLIWEQYAYPVDLKTLEAGNSQAVIFNATPVTQLTPPEKPRDDVLLNKTGSTNGFGAYVAFVPDQKFGIVILANKNYSIEERVTIAHQILTKLTSQSGG